MTFLDPHTEYYLEFLKTLQAYPTIRQKFQQTKTAWFDNLNKGQAAYILSSDKKTILQIRKLPTGMVKKVFTYDSSRA